MKVAAWAIDDKDRRIEFESETDHCPSCLDEKEQGYGSDIDGCCCIHVSEFHEKH